jgi:spermidine synthase
MLPPTHGLRLPANGQRGDWRVTREPRSLQGEEYECVFLRQRQDKRWRAWMSDHPIEMAWTKRLADRTTGDCILIGGLGLGLLPQLLLPRAGRTVTILENAPEVIDLVLRDWEMPDGCMVQQADVWEFLRYPPSLPRYDTVIMDIWSTVDDAERREIVRLRQLAEPWLTPEGVYIAWGDSWLNF